MDLAACFANYFIAQYDGKVPMRTGRRQVTVVNDKKSYFIEWRLVDDSMRVVVTTMSPALTIQRGTHTVPLADPGCFQELLRWLIEDIGLHVLRLTDADRVAAS